MVILVSPFAREICRRIAAGTTLTGDDAVIDRDVRAVVRPGESAKSDPVFKDVVIGSQKDSQLDLVVNCDEGICCSASVTSSESCIVLIDDPVILAHQRPSDDSQCERQKASFGERCATDVCITKPIPDVIKEHIHCTIGRIIASVVDNVRPSLLEAVNDDTLHKAIEPGFGVETSVNDEFSQPCLNSGLDKQSQADAGSPGSYLQILSHSHGLLPRVRDSLDLDITVESLQDQLDTCSHIGEPATVLLQQGLSFVPTSTLADDSLRGAFSDAVDASVKDTGPVTGTVSTVDHGNHMKCNWAELIRNCLTDRPRTLVEIARRLNISEQFVRQIVSAHPLICTCRFDVSAETLDNDLIYLVSSDIPAHSCAPINAVVKDRHSAEALLESQIIQLEDELSRMQEKRARLDRHIQVLHSYNEAKDTGQMLLGQLAEIEACASKTLYSRFNLREIYSSYYLRHHEFAERNSAESPVFSFRDPSVQTHKKVKGATRRIVTVHHSSMCHVYRLRDAVSPSIDCDNL